METRLLITGARGFLAGSVIAQASPALSICALSRQAPLRYQENLRWVTCDPLDFSGLGRLVAEWNPTVILHAAAIAGIDVCEADQAAAWRVNVALTEALLEAAGQVRARFIYVSTDNVFDGVRGGYSETDVPAPVNFYGQTKAAAEELVANSDGAWVVARPALIMGFPAGAVPPRALERGTGPIPHPNSFLTRIVSSLQHGEIVGVPDDEIRSPIDVVTLGRALLELSQNSFAGFLHLAGNTTLNRCALVRRIAAHMGFSPDLVQPNDPTLLPGRAPRPRDVSLSNALARATLKTPMLDIDPAIELMLAFADALPPKSAR